VLPASDFELGLAAGHNFADADMNVARKLRVTDAEVDKLCAEVLRALAGGQLEPDAIRAAVGEAARNLGEEGKKKGVGTTLPLALGRLQAEGEIRRVPVNGRLDQQRYAYTLWGVRNKLPEEDTFTELARRYFRWVGPAALAEFQWFAGLSAKAAKAAVTPLGLVPFDEEPGRLLFADDHEAYRSFRASKDPQYVLVSSLDSISALRRDVKSLLAAEDATHVVFADRGGPKPLGGLSDLPNHAILDRGRLVGLWEFDTVLGEIAWTSFVPRNEALVAAVKETERYIQDQLGDARSFSLDSPKSREPRIAALRGA
jgi:hypothetical protein